MKTFAERNPLVVGAVGAGLTVATVFGALNYDKLPLINQARDYSAYFTEAGGLVSSAPVQVSGLEVGKVNSIGIDGPRVLVRFHVDNSIAVGERTEAAIKTKGVLGAKVLELTPRGERRLHDTIPVERTRSPYQLPDALGDLAETISGLNTDQLSQSLAVLSDTFKDTPRDVKAAVKGVERFSQTLDARNAQLRELLANANKATTVLAQRSDELVGLLVNANALLAQLQSQSSALQQVSGNISAAARQLKGFISEQRDTLKPALDKLNGVLEIVDNRKERIQLAVKKLNSYIMSLGEAISSGPFFKAYLVNLLPGQYLQPYIDAAFSDLGLDSATLLPSQRTDPGVGQPATPPLPLPYPRTGQGGEPNRNLPDAITGNPGQEVCGSPVSPEHRPGCYPYREAPPAPPPGGPPPGPPAPPPGGQPIPEPTPTPIYVPAPGEVTPR